MATESVPPSFIHSRRILKSSRSLDRSENATLGMEEQRAQSQNMDDTGFFSISVLEKVGGIHIRSSHLLLMSWQALQVFDLSLVRWRSPEMAVYQDRPE